MARGYVEVVAELIPASLAHYLRAAFDVLFASAVGDFLTLWVLIVWPRFAAPGSIDPMIKRL
jgi:hypothetical protein